MINWIEQNELDEIVTKDFAYFRDIEGGDVERMVLQLAIRLDHVQTKLLETIREMERVYQHHAIDLDDEVLLEKLVSPYPEILGTSENKPVRHIPERSIILTSNPPKYYCFNEKGERNECYCHFCDWPGWETDEPVLVKDTWP